MDREEILKELDEFTKIPTIGPEDFTLDFLCERYGYSPPGMRYRMMKLVEEGTWGTAKKMNPQSRRMVRVWWKVQASS